ncbi:methyl-accepting chemotaxis protein [Paralcaligenes sp. KSB-10]|uniref:methyl-accepting chemotaxis protein n=1 Tax=Paralcaligenes sp. KSB-10 TaxID=2901142 RepID=UPI001E5519E8|nr:methyl-accepting chemotaxis protein [Paralcaligenes sp. KSB-10]UHL65306.1 methyl-accepting chemotaxis protein [Paralcaligenes sp. KSB-10]
MKFKRLQLKTSLSLMVFFLSLLTFFAVGIGWNSLYTARQQMNALSTSSIEAGREVKNAYEQSRYAQPAVAAQGLEAAFKRFDQYLAGEYSDTSADAAKLYQQALYVFGCLIVLAIVLALAAYRTLSRTVLRPLKQAGAHFDRIASGDLTERIEVTTQNEIGMLYASLKRMQDSLGRIVGTVRQGMDQINTGSQRIVLGNTDLSSRTEQQAAALQQTAASMEQLASTVKQNADNARQANQLAASASEVAQRGGHAVGEVVTTMQGISASSRKISDIVGVIDSIAFQTNILALNAAVEAARAGEQGKGFAVVAAEVRALAQRSAQAAKEIKGLIEDSVKKVTEGSTQVEQAGATMEEIVVSVARVTDIMGEISAATTEQSTGIDQINRAVTQMDDVTQQNATLVQEAASLAAALREQVAQVSDAVSVFKTIDKQVIDVAATAIATTAGKARAATAAGSQATGRALPSANSANAAGAASATALAAASLQAAARIPGQLPGRVPAYAGATGAAAAHKPISQDDWEEF